MDEAIRFKRYEYDCDAAAAHVKVSVRAKKERKGEREEKGRDTREGDKDECREKDFSNVEKS